MEITEDMVEVGTRFNMTIIPSNIMYGKDEGDEWYMIVRKIYMDGNVKTVEVCNSLKDKQIPWSMERFIRWANKWREWEEELPTPKVGEVWGAKDAYKGNKHPTVYIAEGENEDAVYFTLSKKLPYCTPPVFSRDKKIEFLVHYEKKSSV